MNSFSHSRGHAVKILLDDSIPRSAARVLEEHGYVVERLHSCGLRGADNPAVFRHAQANGQLLITRDLSLMHLALQSPGDHAGVLILSLPEPLSAEATASALLRIFQQLGARSLKNAVVVAEPQRIRIRTR